MAAKKFLNNSHLVSKTLAIIMPSVGKQTSTDRYKDKWRDNDKLPLSTDADTPLL